MPPKTNTHVRSELMFRAAMKALETCDTMVVDLETDGLRPWHGNRLCGIAIKGVKNGRPVGTFYFPFRHGDGYNLPLDLLDRFKPLLSNPEVTYIGHNYKFDLQFLLQEGIQLPSKIEDTMLAAHLMNENEKNFKLKELADKYLGEGSSDEQTALYARLAALGYKGKGAAGDMWRLPAADVAPYAMQDADITWGLREFYRPHLQTWRLDAMHEEICRYQLITTRTEIRGLLVDVDLTRVYNAEASEKVGPARERINEQAGYAINLKSSKQLQALLGVDSTREEILDSMVKTPQLWEPWQTQIARTILDFRGWDKVQTAYYNRYLEEVDEKNVLRPSLSLTGTISGRLSCRYPNLQAVPTYSEVYKVKDVFVARPGYTLVSADYSQAELRLAAHYTEDENLLGAFSQGIDIHQMTADLCNIDRNYAKRINFGVVYGIGKVALARQLGISEDAAAAMLNKFHKQFPGYRRLYNYCDRTAAERGYIRMWTGRCRRYDSANPTHKASSNLIQGGVAEMMRTSVLKLDALLADQDVHQLLQVHDQILFEVPENRADELIAKIVDTMEDLPFKVKMKVDVSVGQSWGKLQKWQQEAKCA